MLATRQRWLTGRADAYDGVRWQQPFFGHATAELAAQSVPSSLVAVVQRGKMSTRWRGWQGSCMPRWPAMQAPRCY